MKFKLRTGWWYEMNADMDARRAAGSVMEHEVHVPPRSERRKAERKERREQGRQRSLHHEAVQKWAADRVKGRKAQKFAVIEACARVSREARYDADHPRPVEIIPYEETK